MSELDSMREKFVVAKADRDRAVRQRDEAYDNAVQEIAKAHTERDEARRATTLALNELNEKRIASHTDAVDRVNHPAHYTSHPSGVECITVTEHMSFSIGNAIKYLWRAGLKSADAIEDLRKAAWYVNGEIERLSR